MKATNFLLRNVLIVESPNKARVISSYLGKDWRVLSTKGHISYMFSIDTIKRVGLHSWDKAKVNALKRDVEAAHVEGDRICIATDPDREGELIASEVMLLLKKMSKTTKLERVVYKEVTKLAITKALSKPVELNKDLVDAGNCRRLVDWWFGIAASRHLNDQSSGNCKSAGRVQTPALSLIAIRDKERKEFVSETLFSVQGKFTLGTETHKVTFSHNKSANSREEDSRKKLLAHIEKHNNFKIKEKTTSKREAGLDFFDTASVLKEATNSLKMSAKEVSPVYRNCLRSEPLHTIEPTRQTSRRLPGKRSATTLTQNTVSSSFLKKKNKKRRQR
eukprot:TRINITY_DN18632_c0_g1_i1.p1 TRINITY_DN18632_c0_g1~~TRINITY_DN18632_c0_g1_i1.p1  ORF type:complete len:333 (+),score=53.74 TRINITY_DN18632_c0_g1_i1:45-1043(+)